MCVWCAALVFQPFCLNSGVRLHAWWSSSACAHTTHTQINTHTHTHTHTHSVAYLMHRTTNPPHTHKRIQYTYAHAHTHTYTFQTRTSVAWASIHAQKTPFASTSWEPLAASAEHPSSQATERTARRLPSTCLRGLSPQSPTVRAQRMRHIPTMRGPTTPFWRVKLGPQQAWRCFAQCRKRRSTCACATTS
jgi:hypothetical protein